MSAFDPLKAAGTAFHELALQEAFELLALVSGSSDFPINLNGNRNGNFVLTEMESKNGI